MATAYFLGVLLVFGTYGAASSATTRAILRSPQRGGKRVALLALCLVTLWPLCVYVGMKIASLLPVQWGHAGVAYYGPVLALSPIIFLTDSERQGVDGK